MNWLSRKSVCPRGIQGAVARLALASIVVSVCVTGTAVSANAGPEPAFTIKDAQCSGKWTWQGDVRVAGMLGTWPVEDRGKYQNRGNWRLCADVLKVIEPKGDGDPRHDYYAIRTKVNWGTYSGGRRGVQGARLTIRSNVSASISSSTPTVENKNCRELPISVSLSFISLDLNPKICDGVVTRERFEKNRVAWTTRDVTRTPGWDVAWIQQVPEGAKPAYTVFLEVPKYRVGFEEEVPGNGWTTYGRLKREEHYSNAILWMRPR